MYLDFEDYRPDTPRVASAISRREGILLSLLVHALFVIGILVMPLGRPATDEMTPLHQQEPVRYVQVSPLVDRLKTPRLTAEQSDADRRSATRERARAPENAMPFARGNTPEKVQGAPEERAAGPESPVAAPAPAPPQPEVATKVAPNVPAVPVPPTVGGSLGSSLRNLQRYLQDDNFNNQRGGFTEQDPDIQFDSKGVEFGPWLRRFVSQVKKNWFVPEAAWTLKGRVVIQFYVLKDGTIIDIRVVHPSGIDSFNTAAFNALKMSNPTVSLPTEYPADRVFFTVTFHYNDGLDH